MSPFFSGKGKRIWNNWLVHAFNCFNCYAITKIIGITWWSLKGFTIALSSNWMIRVGLLARCDLYFSKYWHSETFQNFTRWYYSLKANNSDKTIKKKNKPLSNYNLHIYPIQSVYLFYQNSVVHWHTAALLAKSEPWSPSVTHGYWELPFQMTCHGAPTQVVHPMSPPLNLKWVVIPILEWLHCFQSEKCC